MPKEFSGVIKVCDLISKYSIYILAGLMPVFFLPITSDVLDFNKQTVLVLLVFVSLFSWMVKILVSGKFSANLNKTHIAISILILFFTASTIFSQDRYGSFWGWPRITAESLLTLVSLSLLYVVVANIFSKKEILVSIITLCVSSLVAILFSILQLFGVFIIPLNFAKTGSFNTFGSVGNLGLILALLIPILTMLEITISEKWLRIVFAIGIVMSAIGVLAINYLLVWWIVLISSALLIAFGMFKRNLFDLRWLAIPIFFFVLALFFIIVNPSISAPQRPVEVYLNQSASADVAIKSIKDNPILGSGPGTFAYNFLKYKKQDFNQNPLWNYRFDSGASKMITILSTVGFLGFLAFLFLIGIVGFYGIMFITKEITGDKLKSSEKSDYSFKLITAGIFVAILAQSIAYFLMNSGITLDFIYFLLIGCFIGLISTKKDYNLSPSSFLTLGVTLVFTLVFIFGFGLIILQGQRYLAEFKFNSGLSAYAKSQPDKGLKDLESSIRHNPKADIYFTNLAQAYLGKVADLLSKKELLDTEKEQLQLYVNNAINAVKIATDLNPKNIYNWSIGGAVYQNFIGIVPDAETWAIKNYEEAIKLDPNNPYYATQKGIILLSKAYNTDKDNESEKKKDLELAKEQFDKAIKLKSDYSSARFQLAMVYSAQGKTDQVMPALQEAKKYAQNDVGLSFQIGLLYYQSKDYKNAQKELERTVFLNNKYSNALYFLGLTYSALGQNDKAIDSIKKVLELNPNNEEVKKVLSNLQSGKNPLDGIVQENPAKVPVEDETLDKTKK